MRICYVAYQFWPSIGGSQAQAEKQAGLLSQLGQEVLVVTLRHQKAWPAEETYRSFSVIRVGGWYRRGGTLRAGKLGYLLVNVCMFLTLWRLRQKYDLIHTLQFSPQAAVAVLIGKLTHKPVIIGVQNTGSYELLGDRLAQKLQKNQFAEGVHMPGQGTLSIKSEVGGDLAQLQQMAWGGRRMVNYIRKAHVYYQVLSSRSYQYLLQHKFCQERIIYIPNGVDTQSFYPVAWTRPEEMALRKERLFICVARLEYAKGIDVLLRAWALMMALPPAWREGLRPRLRLVGDGTCRRQLERLTTELGIQESVEFCGTRLDVPGLLQEAWGFVLPSRWEGMPNALLEAMSCALPCIATRVSGSEDVLEQGQNGLLVEPEQPQQFAYALRLLVEDADLAMQLGWSGYETVLRYYQLGTTVQGCLAFYRYLLSRGTAQRIWPDPIQFDDLSPWRQGYE
ncbi:MAG TPA: glycosyltransferase family 4 protein [Ktedonobacteraceae bacterium]|jgi:glycosyltransferase involved in cell wall biosynthesis